MERPRKRSRGDEDGLTEEGLPAPKQAYVDTLVGGSPQHVALPRGARNARVVEPFRNFAAESAQLQSFARVEPPNRWASDKLSDMFSRTSGNHVCRHI